MERLKQAAILNQLMKKLRARDNWCGETSVQKASYILQEVLDVPFGFDFILYKHGPFSFDLRDELTAERADGLMALESEPGYGPRYAPTPQGDALAAKYPQTQAKYERVVEFVANKVDDKGITELEQLATAIWVTHEMTGSSPQERAERLHNLKPHITLQIALKAITDADGLLNEANDYQFQN